MSTPEGKVKERIKDIFIRRGVWYCMPVAGLMGRAGVPDFIACCNGKFIAVEAKSGKRKPTALQSLALAAIRRTGGVALVVNEDNIKELENMVDDAIGKEHSGVPRAGRGGGGS